MNSDVALATELTLALYAWQDFRGLDLDLAMIERSLPKTEYPTGPVVRYPDPANLLPDSVVAWIFVHNFMGLGLTLVSGRQAGE